MNPATGLFGPVLKTLRKEGYLSCDMHFHTEYSMDAISKIPNVLKRCRKIGSGIAISDHNNYRGSEHAHKIKNKGDFIIPAIEASTRRGAHSLFYFRKLSDGRKFFEDVITPLRRKNPFFLPILMEQLLEKARDYNALVSLPHPFGPGCTGVKKNPDIKEINKYFDFVEVMNGVCLRGMNEKAMDWAKQVKKGITGGTDGHTTNELGLVQVVAPGSNIDEFFESLLAKKQTVIGTEERFFKDALNQIEKEAGYLARASKTGNLMQWLESHFEIELRHIKNVDKEFIHHFNIQHGHIGNKESYFMKRHKYYKHIHDELLEGTKWAGK